MEQLGDDTFELLPDLLPALEARIYSDNLVILRYCLSLFIVIFQVLPLFKSSPPENILRMIHFLLNDRQLQLISDPTLLASMAQFLAAGPTYVPPEVYETFLELCARACLNLLQSGGGDELDSIPVYYDSLFEGFAAVMIISPDIVDFMNGYHEMLVALVDKFRETHGPPVPAFVLTAYCQFLDVAWRVIPPATEGLADSLVLAWGMSSEVKELREKAFELFEMIFHCQKKEQSKSG
jgi:hypothetical protein